MKMVDETYLGDGAYAGLTDTGDLRVRAPRERGDDEVWLDAGMLQTLVDYARRWGFQVK